jgi:predicted component of viral defense system (DUF524 family)
MYQKIKKDTGLTLIELLLAAVLFSVIIGSSVFLLSIGLKVWDSNKDRVEIRQEGNLGIETMVRYLSLASNITAASTTSMKFSSDVNNDGTNERVTLAFDSSNKKINKTLRRTTTTLTPYVQSFSFSYCQANTDTTFTPVTQADRDTIKIVIISMTMNKGSDTISLSSSAYCRNQT